MAKTAQIMSLAHNANWRHYPTAADYYSKDLFSAYYLAAMFFQKVTHLPPLVALNLFSVGCGIVFLTVTPAFLCRAFGLPPWLAWISLMSAPILVITFTYGNEAAPAIALTALAAFALTFKSITARILAAVFYVGAAYCRSDYLFLWPALSFLTLVRQNNRIDWRQSIRNVLPFAIASAALGVAYLAIVLRKWPEPEYFPYRTNPKVFLAFWLYAPNPLLWVFAVVGVALCLVRRRFEYFLLLPVFVQFVPYATHFTSPKYIVPSVVVVTIFAVAGMVPLARRAPFVLAAVLAVPWLVSVTPYGIRGPARAAFWYVPTDDGPLPTGGYLPFYVSDRRGLYQQRYDQELRQIGEAMPRVEAQPGANIVGFFNQQSLWLWSARNGRWNQPLVNVPFWVLTLGDGADHRPRLMIRTSYLYALRQSAELQAQLTAACNEGRVKTVAGEAEPLPDVIECGPLVPAGTDAELGRRITFMNTYSQGNAVLRRESFLEDFAGVSWIPRARFTPGDFPSVKPLYADSQWVCLGENVTNAIYYSLRFPPAYSSDRRPVM